MQLALASKLALLGMVGLALLQSIHWLRERVENPSDALALTLGSVPNLAAGYAMPLVATSLLYAASPTYSVAPKARRSFLFILLLTTSGLMVYEVGQLGLRNMVFDPIDLIATLVGALAALGVYRQFAHFIEDMG